MQERLISNLMFGTEMPNEEPNEETDERIDELILQRIEQEEKDADWVLIEEKEDRYVYQDRYNQRFYKEITKDGNWEASYKKD